MSKRQRKPHRPQRAGGGGAPSSAGENLVVSPATAQALHDASDHLPVVLELLFARSTSGVRDEEEWELDLARKEEERIDTSTSAVAAPL